MDHDIWIRDALLALHSEFARTAAECVHAMFQTTCETREPWTVAPTLEGTFDYIFSLVSHNRQYKSTLCAGIALESINAFTGCDLTLDEAKDAFCEFANIYCGMINDLEPFTRDFGVLKQGLPEDAVVRTFFPQAWAIHGHLYVREHRLYVGYSIAQRLDSESA